MNDLVFPAPLPPRLPVRGSRARFPLRRIFCAGRNYAAHAKELGAEAARDAPFFFTKSCFAAVAAGGAVAYPPATRNYQYELELVIAIGAPAFRIAPGDTLSIVFGYACGLDMTRRDLQLAARRQGKPWDMGKDVEESAVVGLIAPASDFTPDATRRLRLSVDGERRQDAALGEMIWSPAELIAALSTYCHLMPGDLLFTGTPAGVGPVGPGARLHGEIDGLDPIDVTLGGE